MPRFIYVQYLARILWQLNGLSAIILRFGRDLKFIKFKKMRACSERISCDQSSLATVQVRDFIKILLFFKWFFTNAKTVFYLETLFLTLSNSFNISCFGLEASLTESSNIDLATVSHNSGILILNLNLEKNG